MSCILAAAHTGTPLNEAIKYSLSAVYTQIKLAIFDQIGLWYFAACILIPQPNFWRIAIVCVDCNEFPFHMPLL